MLIRRIVADTLRRMWVVYACSVGLVFFLSWIASSMREGGPFSAVDHLFAWSMAACWFLACSPTLMLETGVILWLPVSRREMWLAKWWLAVATPPAAMAIALAGGALLGLRSSGPERYVLAILYCVLYNGCFMSVSAMVPRTGEPQHRGLAVTFALIRLVVIPIGGAVLPLWFAQYLPQTFSSLNGPAMGTLIAAAGITIASYLNRPAIVAGPGRARVAASKTPAARRASVLDGLSGLTLLFFKEARKALLLYVSLLALSVVFWATAGSGTLADFFRDGSALIFSGLPERSSTGFPAVAMFLMAGISDIGLMGDMRNLRALPVSAMRLSAILTSLTVMTTLVLWVVLLAAHLVAVGSLPSSIRPDLFLVVLGGLAISHTMRVVWPTVGTARVAAGAITLAPMLIAFRLGYAPGSVWVRAAMIGGGSAALVISWLINVRALRRGTRIYKMKPPAVPAISS